MMDELLADIMEQIRRYDLIVEIADLAEGAKVAAKKELNIAIEDLEGTLPQATLLQFATEKFNRSGVNRTSLAKMLNVSIYELKKLVTRSCKSCQSKLPLCEMQELDYRSGIFYCTDCYELNLEQSREVYRERMQAKRQQKAREILDSEYVLKALKRVLTSPYETAPVCRCGQTADAFFYILNKKRGQAESERQEEYLCPKHVGQVLRAHPWGVSFFHHLDEEYLSEYDKSGNLPIFVMGIDDDATGETRKQTVQRWMQS